MGDKPNYLYIDSRDKVSGTTNNFTVQLPSAIHSAKEIVLEMVAFPNTSYIVNEYNDRVYINNTYGLIEHAVYDYLTLAAAVDAAIATTSYAGVTTTTYDVSQYMYTITGTIPFDLKWQKEENSAAELLGFDNYNHMGLSAYTSDFATSVSLPYFVFIDIPEFSSNVRLSDGTTATFALVSSVISGEITYHLTSTHYRPVNTHGSLHNFQHLNIRLKSRNNRDLDLRGAHWGFVLRIEYLSPETSYTNNDVIGSRGSYW